MNSRFKVLLISLGLSVLGFAYLFYVINSYVKEKSGEIAHSSGAIIEETQVGTGVELEEETEVQLEKNPGEQETKISGTQKIKEIRDRKNKYAYFKLEEVGSFYFEDNGDNLSLFYNDKNIGEFQKIDKEKLNIRSVLGNNSFILLNIGKDKFIYSLTTKEIKEVDIDLDIEYIKAGINQFEFLIKTKVGTFVYSIIDGTLEYFVFFSDFLYYDNGYLGIIQKDEDVKLKNLGFEEETQNLIIYYNPLSKEKTIIHRTKLELSKIYYKNDKIYFQDDSGEEYELKNLGKDD